MHLLIVFKRAYAKVKPMLHILMVFCFVKNGVVICYYKQIQNHLLFAEYPQCWWKIHAN